MALTGTPLINDVEDFRAIWQFLGWIEERKPGNELMAALEETGLTPADHAFYPAARTAVVDLGIVRRRKVDVAADIPARRVADLPVELEGAVGRSIRDAERQLAERLVGRYQAARRAPARRRRSVEGIDHALVRRVAEREVAEAADEARPGTTSSRWCAGSARPRPSSPPTTRCSWPAAPARSSSSPSTST